MKISNLWGKMKNACLKSWIKFYKKLVVLSKDKDKQFPSIQSIIYVAKHVLKGARKCKNKNFFNKELFILIRDQKVHLFHKLNVLQ